MPTNPYASPIASGPGAKPASPKSFVILALVSLAHKCGLVPVVGTYLAHLAKHDGCRDELGANLRRILPCPGRGRGGCRLRSPQTQILGMDCWSDSLRDIHTIVVLSSGSFGALGAARCRLACRIRHYGKRWSPTAGLPLIAIGNALNGARLRHKQTHAKDLGVLMPPACPGDAYVPCYNEQRKTPKMPPACPGDAYVPC